MSPETPPSGFGAETEYDSVLGRSCDVLRKEGANRGSPVCPWRARREEHCMLIIEADDGINVARVIGLDPDLIDGMERRHVLPPGRRPTIRCCIPRVRPSCRRALMLSQL
jgi:hypothetical protein